MNSLIVTAILVTWYCSMLPQSSSVAAYSPKDVTKDYCEAEKFRPSCSHDEVIEMKQALYGRMERGRCAQIDMGHLGCHDDVLDLADDLCSGRRSCEISIPEQTFEQTRPCLELKSYLKASYTCIKVNTLDSVDCTKPLRARSPSGRISSITANESRCLGTYDTTWLIQGLPGQQVNISLLDFKAAAATHRRRPVSQDTAHTVIHSQTSNGGADTMCHKYATITESPDNHLQLTGTDHLHKQSQSYQVVGLNHERHSHADHAQSNESNRSSVVCGRRARWQHVYTSTSHMVEIKLEWHRSNPNYYVIIYEVFGCPDPQLPSTMWFQRHNAMEATVGCQLSAGNWRLTCGTGNEWVGDTGNCTQYETIELAVRSTSMETTTTAGLLTAVLCICAFFIATLVIVTGVFLHRRRRRRGVSRPGSLSKAGGGAYDVTIRGHASPKSDYGDLPEDYDDDIVIGGDMAYVYPSKSRTEDGVGTSTSRRQRPSDDSESGCESVAYDVVDGTTVPIKSNSDGPYEKVSTCRYIHIWEMPLPKAPDE